MAHCTRRTGPKPAEKRTLMEKRPSRRERATRRHRHSQQRYGLPLLHAAPAVTEPLARARARGIGTTWKEAVTNAGGIHFSARNGVEDIEGKVDVNRVGLTACRGDGARDTVDINPMIVCDHACGGTDGARHAANHL